MQKKNAPSNGVVMRRGVLPDKLASMRYDDKTLVKYSLNTTVIKLKWKLFVQNTVHFFKLLQNI